MAAVPHDNDTGDSVEVRTFREVLAAQGEYVLPMDDVLAQCLPLLQEVAALHAQGHVAALHPDAVIQRDRAPLALKHSEGVAPKQQSERLRQLQPRTSSALQLVGTTRVTHDMASGLAQEDLQVLDDTDAGVNADDGSTRADLAKRISHPVYLTGYRCWEAVLGHHDELTDVFMLGQYMAALALGLDFDDVREVRSLAAYRGNLFRIHPRINPVLANVLAEMLALDRRERASDLATIILRLQNWRDLPQALEVERVLAATGGLESRRSAVMTHLRNRLFDLSRRNRLVYFRPTQSSVNLTEASVPLVMRVASIQLSDLCVWQGTFAESVLSGRAVNLNRWLRFDDHIYLASALDRVIQETRRQQHEYGFNHLRLVIAFLRWNNLKETPDERIVSPLLWLPVTVSKKKGVRDQYLLEFSEDEAEFNPALRHQLNQLYGIELPESVDLKQVSIAQVVADLGAQVQRSEPGVRIELQDRPAIELIHQKAVNRLQQYQRRRGMLTRRLGSGRPDYSYAADDYRPLGLAWFRMQVRPSPLPQRAAVGAPPRFPGMVAASQEQVTFALSGDRGHRYAWDVDLTQVTLAHFNYKKMSLVRDYNQLIAAPRAAQAFDQVFAISPRPMEEVVPRPLPLTERWNVVAADATQNAAIAQARGGRSLIIQGPPGTGKSQTITNLIADYVARGKRVLFVCEKRAALDVVFHRLKQSGLEALCTLVHDSQSDKKAFVADLRECYERWMAEADQLTKRLAARSATMGAMQGALLPLEAFERTLQAAPAEVGMSARALVLAVARYPGLGEALDSTQRERLVDLAVWLQHQELTERWFRLLNDRLGVRLPTEHVFSRLAPGAIAAARPVGDLTAFVDAEEPRLEQLMHALEALDDTAARHLPLAAGCDLARVLRRAADAGLARSMAVVLPSSLDAQAFDAARVRWQSAKVAAERATAGAAAWRNRPTPAEARDALVQAQRLEPSPLRWLQPTWWRLRGEVGRRYDFSGHMMRPTLTAVLTGLVEAQQAEAAFAAADAETASRFKLPAFSGAVEAVEAIRQALMDQPEFLGWVDRLAARPDAAELVAKLGAQGDRAAALQAAIVERIAEGKARTLDQLAEILRDLRETIEDLPDAVGVLREIHAAGPAYAYTVTELPLARSQLDAAVHHETWQRLLRKHPELSQFDSAALTHLPAGIARREREWLSYNAAVINATRHQQFRDAVRRSSLSVSRLDTDARAFKKQYAAGRRELEHEFGKSMRHRSIREMADGDSGCVINDLKPIWLMSPLSVSDTLPLDEDLFDVVVFDEASQIPVEEAVPALCRARQIIVVGDEKQLPPTSFFSTSVAEDDLSVVATDGDDRIAIAMDAESLLVQAARNLPATLLAWHYRSRHEALISFSNAAFYDGRLVTIPDRMMVETDAAFLTAGADDAQAHKQAVERIVDHAISYHLIEDGCYLDRRNAAEARYIAGVVRGLLQREAGLSIGIVAFSEAQQDEIESALGELAAKDADFATRLEQEYAREEDDQFNGLFVKNLENVQGDERDVILLSICYGPGLDGRMLMNFGPINQRGGEKRLNVIFSRARKRMAVVASILGEAITNTHNEGAFALKTFLQFAQASASGQAAKSQVVLRSLSPAAQSVFGERAGHDAIRVAIANALRARGHQVHELVGRSSFRCDLAVTSTNALHLRLAILIDASEGVGTQDAEERFAFRPNVLRAFGWLVVQVVAREWLQYPERVLGQIERTLIEGDREAPESPEQAAEASATPAPAVVPFSADTRAPQLQFSEFWHTEGASDKFWRIAQTGKEVTVMFGRRGSKGQTLIKVFDSAERAAAEVTRLVEEKLRKGYFERAASNDQPA